MSNILVQGEPCVRIRAEETPEGASPLYKVFVKLKTEAEDRGRDQDLVAYGDISVFRDLSCHVVSLFNVQVTDVDGDKREGLLITELVGVKLVYKNMIPPDQVFFYSGEELLLVANAVTGKVVDIWNHSHYLLKVNKLLQ